MTKHMQHKDRFAKEWHLPMLPQVGDYFRQWRLRHALKQMAAQRHIRLDIAESDDAYLIKAEMPGCQKEALRVEIDGNTVLIAADAPVQEGSADGARQVAPQYRYFALQHALDDSAASARYHRGVLELFLPKKKSGANRYLPIS